MQLRWVLNLGKLESWGSPSVLSKVILLQPVCCVPVVAALVVFTWKDCGSEVRTHGMSRVCCPLWEV